MDGDSPRDSGDKTGRIEAFIVGLACFFLLNGCANISEKQIESVKKKPEPEAIVSTPSEVSPVSPEEETPSTEKRELKEVASPPEAPAGMPLDMGAENKTEASAEREVSPPTEKKVSPSVAEHAPQAKTVIPPPVTEPSPPVEKTEPPPVTAPSSTGNVPNVVEKELPPPLDLTLLKERLKETTAIGLFTKLALKNQVDDLVEQFQAYYQGRSKRTLSQLREPYELLIMKVLVLLQDSDPQLGRDLLKSREAIWQVLSDKEKFEAL